MSTAFELCYEASLILLNTVRVTLKNLRKTVAFCGLRSQ